MHPGLHKAIVDRALFEAVQDCLDANRRRRVATATSGQRAALVGRLFDGRGEPLSPTTSKGRNGRAYRYYVSASLQQGRTSASGLRVHYLAIELHVHLIEVPSPVPNIPHPVYAPATDLACEHWTKAVPPQTHGLMAKVVTALKQKILDVPQRHWKPHIQHHDLADQLGR